MNASNKAFWVILKGLLSLGILKGNLEDLFDDEIHYFFMPHSLGHYIGYKTHDVGLQRTIPDDPKGKLTPYHHTQYNSCSFEVARKGMVVTVEPGIYFIK